MLSLDEPLDLKLRGRVRLGKRACSAPIYAPLSASRPRLLRPLYPSPPASPGGPPRPQDSEDSCTPPAMDLSLSPSSRHAPSPSCSSPSFSSPASPPEPPSPHGSSPNPHLFTREVLHSRYLEGGASPQGFQFFLPVGNAGGGFNMPSSMFIGRAGETGASPEPSSDEQLACRWMRCHLLFNSLQDLVEHINDYHVKPEKDSGYCCQWDGCARNGRGFNARYKMLIHIRTHTNEKPHHCPTCNKSFSRLENLKIHTRSHTGEKPYICPYEGCSKRYSNSSDRFKHTRTHYVDKPYYCKMAGCLKRYTDPSSLRKHIKAHGHFVAQDQGSAGRLGDLLKTGDGPGFRRPNGALELPYVGGAHIIIPGGGAALLGRHILSELGGASLPLSTLCPLPQSLDMSLLGPTGFSLLSLIGGGGHLGLRGDSPLLSYGALGASMRGSVRLGRPRRVESRSEVDGEDGEEEEGGRGEAALNLSPGGVAAGRDPLTWVMMSPGVLALKPAVVS